MSVLSWLPCLHRTTVFWLFLLNFHGCLVEIFLSWLFCLSCSICCLVWIVSLMSLFWLANLNCSIHTVSSELFCPGCLVWIVLSWLSCLNCSLLAVLSELFYLAALSELFFPGCLVWAVLSWLSCLICSFLAVLSELFYPGCVWTVLSRLSCSSCSILAVLSKLFAFLSWLFYLNCSLLSVLSELFSPVLGVLYQLFYPRWIVWNVISDCFLRAVLSWLSSLYYFVLAICLYGTYITKSCLFCLNWYILALLFRFFYPTSCLECDTWCEYRQMRIAL